MTRTIVALAGALYLLCASAQALRPLPPLLRTLSDEVGALTAEEGLELSRAVEAVLEQTGVRVIMVIAETTTPEPVEDYAGRLAQRWKREREIDLDRTIFVVVAVHEREMRVRPGKALVWVDRELAQPGFFADLAPLFRERRYFDALMRVNERLLALILKRNNAI